MAKPLSPRIIRELQRLKREHPQLTKQQLAERFNLCTRTVQRHWVAAGDPKPERQHDPYFVPAELGARWPF